MEGCPHESREALAVPVRGEWVTFFKCRSCHEFNGEYFILAQRPIPEDARRVGREEIPYALLREAEKWVDWWQVPGDMGDLE